MELQKQTRVLWTLALVMALAACSGKPTSPASPSQLDQGTAVASGGPASTSVTGGATIASAPALSRAASNFEIKFLTGMIDHHQMAVMTAEMCMANAITPELRSLCESIRSAQLTEIALMQEWLRDWYGITHEPEMNPGDEKMMERFASLSGAEFEIAFMMMMVKHHGSAIREGRHCLDRAYHAELRDLCEDIIRTQSTEIAQMEAWLCQWYGDCR